MKNENKLNKKCKILWKVCDPDLKFIGGRYVTPFLNFIGVQMIFVLFC